MLYIFISPHFCVPGRGFLEKRKRKTSPNQKAYISDRTRQVMVRLVTPFYFFLGRNLGQDPICWALCQTAISVQLLDPGYTTAVSCEDKFAWKPTVSRFKPLWLHPFCLFNNGDRRRMCKKSEPWWFHFSNVIFTSFFLCPRWIKEPFKSKVTYISLNEALSLPLSVEMFTNPFLTVLTEDFALTQLPWKPLRGEAKVSQGPRSSWSKRAGEPH